MARSSNGGTVWARVDDQYVHADITSFAWKNNNEVWSTSDGGIFKSTDKGITWTTPDNIMFVSEIFYHSISPSFEIEPCNGAGAQRRMCNTSWRKRLQDDVRRRRRRSGISSF